LEIFFFFFFFANSERIDQKVEILKVSKNYVLLLKIQKLEIFTNSQNHKIGQNLEILVYYCKFRKI